jgi:predicted ATPase
MIQLLKVDNYKSLVDFSLSMQQTSLVMGVNGSGKSTLFHVLSILRGFVAEGRLIDDLVDRRTVTRWQQRPNQTFKLEAAIDNDRFSYTLQIEHVLDDHLTRCVLEQLECNSNVLFQGNLDENQVYHAQLFRDDGSQGPNVLADWSRSGLAALQPGQFNLKLTRFREYMATLKTLSPDPWGMSESTEEESSTLANRCENFVSWYRHISQESPLVVAQLFRNLKDFEVLKLAQTGEFNRSMQMAFRHDGTGYSVRWRELSDGQRALIVLYTVLHAGLAAGHTVVIDEPENFLALAEIQPWLVAARDMVEQSNGQLILLSHHPEVINYLAEEHGVLLARDDGGPTRVVPWSEINPAGLTPAELLARGWENMNSNRLGTVIDR